MHELKKLDEKSLLAYWIKGEYDEADMYRELVRGQENSAFRNPSLRHSSASQRSLKSTETRSERCSSGNYGEEPTPPDIPPIEVAPLLEKFERAEDVFEVLQLAMESELLAKRIYERLAEEEKREELKKVYLSLAAVEGSHYERLKGEFEILKELKEK